VDSTSASGSDSIAYNDHHKVGGRVCVLKLTVAKEPKERRNEAIVSANACRDCTQRESTQGLVLESGTQVVQTYVMSRTLLM
jgi:hypothetical protein